MQEQYNKVLWEKLEAIVIRGVCIIPSEDHVHYQNIHTVITQEAISYYQDSINADGCDDEECIDTIPNKWCLNVEDHRIPIYLLIPCLGNGEINLDNIRLINIEYNYKKG